MLGNKKIYFHVDVDSPGLLALFYNTNINYSGKDLLDFYRTSFDRALKFFKEKNIKATFFCVGSDLLVSEIPEIISRTLKEGHAIANHTYTHPYGLCNLSDKEIKKEIQQCSEIIKNITGKKPIGFRTPGYAVNSTIVNILKEEGFKYDSSAGWPLLHNTMKLVKLLQPITKSKMDIGHGETNTFFKSQPYYPSEQNWKRNDKKNNHIKEYPLPHTFGLLPYYNNVLLSLNNQFIKTLTNGISGNEIIFLMHQIEFCEITDPFIPKEIYHHPNLKTSLELKQNKLAFIIELLKLKYNPALLEDEFQY